MFAAAGIRILLNPPQAPRANAICERMIGALRRAPPATWLGFQINAACPASDVYPHYVGVLTRTDGRPHGQAIQQVTWQGRPALQLSRRSNGWNPALDNAALKAEVIAWLTTQ